jgi:hypothetical protein
MPSTLTAEVKVGKWSKIFERNTRKGEFCEILLLRFRVIVLMFARGSVGAQLEVFAGRRRSGASGACDGLIASKLAPTFDEGDPRMCVHRKSTVGASLLAMRPVAAPINQG